MPRRTVVFGIDPGTRVVGYGALRVDPAGPRPLVAGAIDAGRGPDVPARLAEIRRELDDLLARWSPAVVVVEEAFAARNVQSALRLGEGRGVALSAAASCGARVVQYPPALVKKVLVGNGAAHKSQVAAMVAQLLGLARPPEPLDATDALALALTHALRREGTLPGGLGARAGRAARPRPARSPRPAAGEPRD